MPLDPEAQEVASREDEVKQLCYLLLEDFKAFDLLPSINLHSMDLIDTGTRAVNNLIDDFLSNVTLDRGTLELTAWLSQ